VLLLSQHSVDRTFFVLLWLEQGAHFNADADLNASADQAAASDLLAKCHAVAQHAPAPLVCGRDMVGCPLAALWLPTIK